MWVYCAKDTKCVCHEWEIGMHSMFLPNTCHIPHTQGVSYMYCMCMHTYCMCTRTCIVCNDKIKFWFYIGKESTSGILGDQLADVCTLFDGFREVPTIPTKRRTSREIQPQCWLWSANCAGTSGMLLCCASASLSSKESPLGASLYVYLVVQYAPRVPLCLHLGTRLPAMCCTQTSCSGGNQLTLCKLYTWHFLIGCWRCTLFQHLWPYMGMYVLHASALVELSTVSTLQQADTHWNMPSSANLWCLYVHPFLSRVAEEFPVVRW